MDLMSMASSSHIVDSGVDPRREYRRIRKPVVALSRAGMTLDAAVVCVEVFATEDRAFFFFLRRDREGWHRDREVVAWEEPEEEDLTEDPNEYFEDL